MATYDQHISFPNQNRTLSILARRFALESVRLHSFFLGRSDDLDVARIRVLATGS